MSDLCYNCGACHLPQRCEIALKPCELCKQWGHTWNFCHLGARVKQSDYKYYALCHNCDRWHLPEPCTAEVFKCAECNQLGHLPFYCPVRPSPRSTATNGPPEGVSTSEDSIRTVLSRYTTQDILHSPAFARDIFTAKMIAVRDALELAKLYPTEEVFRYLSGAYDGSHLQPRNMAPPISLPTTNYESPTPRYQGHQHVGGNSAAPSPHAVHSTPANVSRFIPSHTPQELERGASQMITPISIQAPVKDASQLTASDVYQRMAQGIVAYNIPVNARPAVERSNQDSFIVSSPEVSSNSSMNATSMSGGEGPPENGESAEAHAGN